ncbi:glycoside hydrolase N-terminal domain-containing protein [Streptomyces sp. 5-10]|uniref:glycoside hydrolase N-terminal domain-containing protein n=1 Tax=Streptomyces sp. 5-10 TaxID=878925 RepID=UPI00168B1294|nr:glycoside hydrolase N-terminal domain-containing protein [Streptomyces sp. 5-10]MBD3003938.1 glycoside hydrolase N-terminal domain-containing protein [Streptomyces sp. 5-10]
MACHCPCGRGRPGRPPASRAAPVAPDSKAAAADPNTLWYAKPAADWEQEALPIGNGAMGAMLSGGVGKEKLQLNEKTLWTGGPGSAGYNFGNWNSSRPTAVQEVVDRCHLRPGVLRQLPGQGRCRAARREPARQGLLHSTEPPS